MKETSLNICGNTLIESECWTYYKFAIMQTSDELPIWLTNHFSVFVTIDGTALFGEKGHFYPVSYYSELLDIIDGEILLVPSDHIVEYLKEKIHQGYYVILDLNYNKLKNENNSFWLHETLIYGYTCDGFYTTLLKNGSFVPQCVPYDIIKAAYDDVLNYYKADVNRLYNRRGWFYGITLIKLRKGLRNDNAYCDALSKLSAEIHGNVYTIEEYGNNAKNPITYFTGSACLKHIVDLLKELEFDDKVFHKMRNYKQACVKIRENQKVLCEIMRWYAKDFKCKELSEIIENYEKSINNIMIAVMLFNKFELTTNNDIIVHIIYRLVNTTDKQLELLENFISLAVSIYKNNLLLKEK